jgi:hypothetical protein
VPMVGPLPEPGEVVSPDADDADDDDDGVAPTIPESDVSESAVAT